MAQTWPRITLVTPVRNGSAYLEDTIRSVVSQGYPNLEYIVVDGESTDGTAGIIRKYEAHISLWFSQPPSGVYAALNAGFSRSTGEIMGWLNASDMMHMRSLFVVGSVFNTFPEVDWITGRPTSFNAEGLTTGVEPLPRWSRTCYLAGANRYIQQESTFWTRRLWDRAGGELSTGCGVAADCELWVRFFRYARLYPVDSLIGGYRGHADALSSSDIEEYHSCMDRVIDAEVARMPCASAIRTFRQVTRFLMKIPKVRVVWRRSAIDSLYWAQHSRSTPLIRNFNNAWTLHE